MERERSHKRTFLDKLRYPQTKKESTISNLVSGSLSSVLALGTVALADFGQAGARGVYSQMPYALGNPFGQNSGNCELKIETSELDETIKSMEKRFNIKIVNPSVTPSITTYPSSLNGKTANVSTMEWDEKNLSNLNEALCEIPPNMYSPREQKEIYELSFASNPVLDDYRNNGLPDDISSFEFRFPDNVTIALSRGQIQLGLDLLKIGLVQSYSQTVAKEVPANFLLMKEPFEEGKVIAAGEYRNGYNDQKDKLPFFCGNCSLSREDSAVFVNDQIILSKESQTLSNNYFLRVTVHELTHRVHAQRLEEMDKELFQILGVEDEGEFKEAKILRLKGSKSFSVFAQRTFEAALKYKSLVAGLIDVDMELKHLEYGNTNLNEFTSVGAEYYLYGKENFLKIYATFIGDERASKLYDFYKKNVFKGKEYN